MRQLLNALVSLILLGVALYFLDWESLKFSLLKIDLWAFGLAVLLNLIIFVALGIRWYWLMVPVVPLPLTEHLKYFFYATFLNTFTPANIGGDAYRVVVLKAHASGYLPVIIALIRERLLGLLAYLMTYLICLPILWHGTSNLASYPTNLFIYSGWIILVGTAGIILTPYLIIPPVTKLQWAQLRSSLIAILDPLRKAASFDSIWEFAALMGYSVLVVFLWVVTVRVIALNLGIQISWAALGAVVVLAELIRLVPITIQGIGLREGAFAYLLALLGQSPESGFVLGTISYLALSCATIISGLLGWGLMQASHRHRLG